MANTDNPYSSGEIGSKMTYTFFRVFVNNDNMCVESWVFAVIRLVSLSGSTFAKLIPNVHHKRAYLVLIRDGGSGGDGGFGFSAMQFRIKVTGRARICDNSRRVTGRIINTKVPEPVRYIFRVLSGVGENEFQICRVSHAINTVNQIRRNGNGGKIRPR